MRHLWHWQMQATRREQAPTQLSSSTSMHFRSPVLARPAQLRMPQAASPVCNITKPTGHASAVGALLKSRRCPSLQACCLRHPMGCQPPWHSKLSEDLCSSMPHGGTLKGCCIDACTTVWCTHLQVAAHMQAPQYHFCLGSQETLASATSQ
jgi:hypothetical protein